LFGKRLAELRTQKGLSQYELARALGFSRGQIANYEQGKREPDFATLITLANFFQVSLDYLLGRTEHPGGSCPSSRKPGEVTSEEVLRGVREDINEYEIEYLKESLRALRKFSESVSRGERNRESGGTGPEEEKGTGERKGREAHKRRNGDKRPGGGKV